MDLCVLCFLQDLWNWRSIQHHTLQEQDVSFSSVGAAGMWLESCKDPKAPLKVSGRRLTKHHTWRITTGELINNATGEKMNLKPQLLHAFSVDEMRDRERAVNNRERQLQAEVCCHNAHSTSVLG